ncbi:iron-containing redox enzyme family protein [Streptomyces sp. NPDC018019]|uniref:iron-containing redox enzyme family protein n=1 Tax=Streptomyces sp. NPDC018019 TaxID=3365030 RepID=UPI00378F0FAB
MPTVTRPDPGTRTLAFAEVEKLMMERLNAWVQDIYHMPFWEAIGRRPDARNLLYGWAVENYHYSAAVRRHIVPALGTGDGSAHPTTRRLLVHLSEEWDHPQLFLDSARRIAQASGSDEDPASSRPIAATQAVVNWLRDAGRSGPLIYKACCATLERTATRVEETRVWYHHVAKVMSLPTAAVAPFIAHAETDEVYEHQNALGEFRADVAAVAKTEVDLALTRAREFISLYRVWQAGIMAHYRHFPAGRGALL